MRRCWGDFDGLIGVRQITVFLMGVETPADGPITVADERVLLLRSEITNRIHTGDIETWDCLLCGMKFSGLSDVSVMAAVVGTKTGIGVIAPICHACDSVNADETARRVRAEFGLDLRH
jgi:hypothetical protein